MKWPFRYRYWLVRTYGGHLEVQRARSDPASAMKPNGAYQLVDGPFDFQEDAARSLAFWRAQGVRAGLFDL